ncbi:MAG: N-acetylneuraminate synthase family protein [Amylibacter sp.]|nr:N-acetylneuraminate synthase family protein [Amylibacter sp.]
MLIAEISSNHSRSLERCLNFIKSAKKCGFDAVKFQLFKIDELFTKEVLELSSAHESRRQWEFPIEFLGPVSDACKQHDLKLGVTPFYLDAVKEAAQYVDFLKVASYELMWLDLHSTIIKQNLPTIISTGMAELEEIITIRNLYKSKGFDLDKLSFLHCESNYPANYKTINLAAIDTMRKQLGCQIGWSDHTKDVDVICNVMFGYGVNMVEMHFDLDGKGEEAMGGHCWLPSDMQILMQKITKFKAMTGNGLKQPALTELKERDWRADPSDGLRPTMKIRDNLQL